MEFGYQDIGIVTVMVHYARTVLMASRHLLSPRFAGLKLECLVSEEVLLRYNPRAGIRIRELHGSQAFMRTTYFEQRGINALLAGNY